MDQYLGLPEKTYLHHLDEYYAEYLPKQYILSERRGISKKYMLFCLIGVLGVVAVTYS
jgi:hypothetical protein